MPQLPFNLSQQLLFRPEDPLNKITFTTQQAALTKSAEGTHASPLRRSQQDLRLGMLEGLSSADGSALSIATRFNTADDSIENYSSVNVDGTAAEWVFTQSPQPIITAANGVVNSVLVRTDSAHYDVDMEAVIESAPAGGLVARYVDANNFYLLSFRDGTGPDAAGLQLYRRSGGSWVSLASAAVPWPLSSPPTVRLRIFGNQLEGYLNGARLVTATDNTFTSGLVGLRYRSPGTTRFRSVTVHTLSSPAKSGTRVRQAPLVSNGICQSAALSWKQTPDSGVFLPRAQVEVPHANTLALTGAFTLEAVVQFRSGSQQGLIEKYEQVAGSGGYGMRLNVNNRLTGFLVSGTSANDVVGATELQPFVRYHLAVTYDPNAKKLTAYVNGVQDAVANTILTPLSCTKSLRLGARGDDGSFPLNGWLYEARLWNTCRTPEEISSSMNKTLTGAEPYLVGLFTFPEASGATTRDRTANGWTGTLQDNAQLFSTTTLVETRLSTDGGASFLHDWKPIANGGAIYGLQGLDLSTVTLSTRQTMTTTNRIVPPTLEALTTEITSSQTEGAAYLTTGRNQIHLEPRHRGVSSVRVIGTEPSGTRLRFLVSTDNRRTWQRYDGTSWGQVELNHIHRQGMTRSTLESISTPEWQGAGIQGPLDIAVGLSTSDPAVTPTISLLLVSLQALGQAVVPTLVGTSLPNRLGLGFTAQHFGTVETTGELTYKVLPGAGEHQLLLGSPRLRNGVRYAAQQTGLVLYAGNTPGHDAVRLLPGSHPQHFGAGQRSSSALIGLRFSAQLGAYPPYFAWRGIEYGIGTDRVRLRPRTLPNEWHPLANYSGEGSYDRSISPYDQIAPNWEKYRNWE